jgi:hypothetical protein
MEIKIAKWYKNANSPVLFMIDDFANVWIDLNNNGKVNLEEDWGHDRNNLNSSFRFLNEEILKFFPEVKITFFTTVGKRSPILKNYNISRFAEPINCNYKIKEFFKSINDNKRFEIAYHGLTHGITGETARDFSQEWVTFSSVEEAINQIEKGKKIYFDTFGKFPKGGKYCGYESNEFSDESIDRTGFLWWCRYWNPKLKNIPIRKRYEIKYFGSNKVIDIPSTFSGSYFTFKRRNSFIRHIFKNCIRPLWIKRGLALLEYLLRNNCIISIQEHIAPSRVDGKRQTPNIFDDKESLKYIFRFLKNKNVWYATGTEIADYFEARENTKIFFVGKDKFKLKYIGKLKNPLLTLLINEIDVTEVISPSGKIFKSIKHPYKCNNNLINIRVENGYYKLK